MLILTGWLLRNHPVAPILLGICVGSAVLLIHSHAISSSQIRDYVNQEVRVEGVISSDPRGGRSKVVGSQLVAPRYSMTMRVESLTHNDAQVLLRIPIRVITTGTADVIPGDHVSITGRVVLTDERDVSALLIASEDISRTEELTGIRKSLERVRSELRRVAMRIGGDSGSLLPGLAIGDTSLQSLEFSELMRGSGLSHLTAVSGANFAIVSAFVFAIFGFLLPRIGPRVALTSLFLFLFVNLVRPTPSVLRAAVMAAIFLISRAHGSRRSAVSALGAAVALLLLINPYQAFEPGFILSVSATSGLIFLAPMLQVRFARAMPDSLAEILAVASAATLFCMPYLMFLSGSVNLATIPANVLVAPAIPLITILVFMAALVVIAFPALAFVILKIANLGASWIVIVAQKCHNAPSLSASPILTAALIALSLLALVRDLRKYLALLLLLMLMINLPRTLLLKNDWLVAQCNVGQGDALLINLGDGNAILFDAGPEPALLDECLSEFAVQRLPLVVISHRHADHFNGLSGIGQRSVGQYWVNVVDPIYQGLENLRTVGAGLMAKVGEASLEVIWAAQDSSNFEVVAGDGSIENNQSIVLIAEFKGAKVLVTGDIEPGVQAKLAQRFDLSDIDILKVPHHGSKFQDPSFLAEVSPEVALISVGKNSYGHPSQEVIAGLEAAGAQVYRSDEGGPISIDWRESQAGPILSPRKQGRQWWQITWR